MHWPTAIITVFGLWLVFTVVKQFTTANAFGTAAKELAGYLLPRWMMFTADLKRLDVYVYIRDFHDDGSVGEWHDATPPGREGAVRFSFPERRLVDGFNRLARRLAHSLPAGAPNLMDLDDPRIWLADRRYRMLLHYALSQDRPENADRRQFLLAIPADDAENDQASAVLPDFSVPNRFPRLVSPFHSFQTTVDPS